MEKSDRDYTHAKRAEDEYRNLIMQYPDNPKLVAEGKKRLLEVQEVLADREFGIGRFYYYRMSYPASIARLRSLVEKYPLYSKADEALFLVGQNYEAQIAQVRLRPTCVAFNTPPGCAGETAKASMIGVLTKNASAAYSQIITRYPVMLREDDAKKRLAALHQPIPRPTKAAVAQNKAEEESRRESDTLDRLSNLVKRGPDVAAASKVGEPPLVDPTPVSASGAAAEVMRQAMGQPAGGHGLSAEIVNGGTPGANEPAPRSDAPPVANADPFARPSTTAAADPNELKPVAAADPNELKPSAPDPNELKPATQNALTSDAAAPPPVQVNEIQQAAASSGGDSAASSSSDSNLASDKDISSSKKKKKKGLKKIVPF